MGVRPSFAAGGISITKRSGFLDVWVVDVASYAIVSAPPGIDVNKTKGYGHKIRHVNAFNQEVTTVLKNERGRIFFDVSASASSDTTVKLFTVQAAMPAYLYYSSHFTIPLRLSGRMRRVHEQP